ncbi:immunity protein Imm33 domain-containing protein [Ruegeria lacuscaerulensis]|uniref:immunity protein Imm33 domain-containing protein n=1 Tax=Ruegeria lacuscaerulensis TaxID=55218 RepID=UPI00147EEA16
MTSPSFRLHDPRPTQKENPYTFHLPSEEELAEVGIGTIVKLIFSAVPESGQYDAERMWVIVERRDGSNLLGRLDNTPEDIPALTLGDPVEFKIHHIVGIDWDDPELQMRFSNDFNKWFGRCFVDDAVLERRARVGYVYREDSEHEEEDKYPDTGWRIRADVEQLSQEEYDDTPCSYVAIGAVLNRDDSFVHLLSEPVGSRFLRTQSDSYERCQEEE